MAEMAVLTDELKLGRSVYKTILLFLIKRACPDEELWSADGAIDI
jgi:hypothetical protein